MDDDFVAPGGGIINAYQRGIMISQRIYHAASNGTETQMADTLEPAYALEQSLEKSQSRIKDSYLASIGEFGHKYSDALIADEELMHKLMALTTNLHEQIKDLDNYSVDPSAFDYGSFRYVQRESERCCEQTVIALGRIHQQLLQKSFEPHELPTPQDDRPQRETVRRKALNPKGAPEVSPISEAGLVSKFSNYVPPGPPPLSEVDVWFDRPRQSTSASTDEYQRNLQAPSPSQHSNRSSNSDKPLPHPPNKYTSSLPAGGNPFATETKDREEKYRSLSPSEISLEKKRQSLQEFFGDIAIGSVRTGSISSDRSDPQRFSFRPSMESSISNNPYFSQGQQLVSRESVGSFEPFGADAISPLFSKVNPHREGGIWDQQRPNSVQRPDESLYSDQGWSSIPGSSRPQQRKFSEPALFGPPESPPLSPDGRRDVSRRMSASEYSASEQTLRAPNFVRPIEDGIEAVQQQLVFSDAEKMLVSESHDQPTPALSFQSTEFPMRHDTSFYKYGGFCDGAKTLVRGARGSLKIHKKPGGQYTQQTAMKCMDCCYEIPCDAYEKDERLDRLVIYVKEDIRFRMRFLSKCHVPVKLTGDNAYACIFCVESCHTIEDNDATVFFSATQLLRHLNRHPRPLRPVEGITVLYGVNSEASDFDLHFKTMEHKTSIYGDTKLKLASRPTAHAIANHRERAKGFRDRDPEDNKTLQFAIGARVAGITFPDRFNGTWCLGYHDGEKAHFPAHTVQLDQPPKDDVTMNPNSTLSATARWEHRPKDPNSGWLSFGKKEKIIHIGFPFQDMWCWTGQNSKGKWGLFPADFMEGLNESLDIGRRGSENKAPAITFSEPFGRPPGSRSGSLSASVTSPQSAGTGQSGWNTLKGKASMKGFGLHRKSTSASHNSQSSNGSSNGRRPSADVIPE